MAYLVTRHAESKNKLYALAHEWSESNRPDQREAKEDAAKAIEAIVGRRPKRSARNVLIPHTEVPRGEQVEWDNHGSVINNLNGSAWIVVGGFSLHHDDTGRGFYVNAVELEGPLPDSEENPR